MDHQNIFDNVDLEVVAYAAFMSILISLVMTMRERNKQRLTGLPLSPWSTVLPDTIIGLLTGVGLALTIPRASPMFNNITGVGFLAGFGGIVGPKLWDLISTNGLGIGLKALAGSLAGPLGKLAQAAQEAAVNPPPVPPPVPSPPVQPKEAGEHDGQTIPAEHRDEVEPDPVPIRDESRPE